MPPAAPGVGCSSACDCPRAVLAPAPSQSVTVTSGSWATALAAASSILSGPRLPPGRSGGGASEFEDDLVICLLSDSVPCTCSKKGRVVGARQSLHLLLRRWCSQMPDPPQSLHVLLSRWCSQMLDPPQSLHRLLRRWCSQILDPPQSLHLLLCRWCSQSLRFCAPPCAAHSASVALRLRPGPSMLQLQPVTAPAPKGLRPCCICRRAPPAGCRGKAQAWAENTSGPRR